MKLKNSLFLFLVGFLAILVSTNSYSSISKLRDRDGQKIKLYFKYLDSGIHKPRLNKKVISIFNQMSPHFKNEISLINLQEKINKKPFRFSNCNNSFKPNGNDVSTYHYLQVIRFCHDKLVKRTKEDLLSKEESNFVKRYYDLLIETENLVLIKLRSSNSVYPRILAEELSLKKLNIDELTELFRKTYAGKHINYGSSLTTHLQKIGLFPTKESKLFKKEFKDLARLALDEKDPALKHRLLEQILSFYSENKLLIGHRYSNKKFRQLTRNLLRAKQTNEAKRFIVKAISTQNDKHKAPLYFERLYIDLKGNDHKSALKFINRSGLLGLENIYDSKLRFWIGRVFYLNKERSISEFLFKSQITKKPLNYYSVLSSAHLSDMGEKKFLEKSYLYKNQKPLDLFPREEETSKENFTRLKLWLKSQTRKIAKLEIKNLLKNSNQPQSMRKIASNTESYKTSFEILRLFQEEDDYLSSFRFFSRNNLLSNFEFLPTATKILFPTPFVLEIKKATKELEPELVLSLIRQESAFNPRAKSHAGARGLMQLMPNTARMYRKKLRKSDLYRPKLNVKLGTKYLKYLKKKYDGSLVSILSAYNAGETNVRRWQGKYINNSNELLNVESIPFEETEAYVKYITRNLFFYKMIFGKPMLSGLEWVTESI
ncbi:MAG: soluble lytic murein transglycosylase [Bacteriovoracaceae bacterium]|jgi:soluble lytic murein transglycosylase